MPANWYIIDHKRRIYACCDSPAEANRKLIQIREGIKRTSRPIDPSLLKVEKYDPDKAALRTIADATV